MGMHLEKCICRKKNGDAVGKMHLQRFKMKMQTIKKFYGTGKIIPLCTLCVLCGE
jgi:hypothetical protein